MPLVFGIRGRNGRCQVTPRRDPVEVRPLDRTTEWAVARIQRVDLPSRRQGPLGRRTRPGPNAVYRPHAADMPGTTEDRARYRRSAQDVPVVRNAFSAQ